MSSTSNPVHRAGLAGQLIAGLGAVLALLVPFAEWIAGAGVFILIVGVVIAAPAGRHPGPHMVEWWSVAAIGALACLVGFGLTFVVAWLGGVILVAGAVAALISVGLGSPVEA
ncbi:MAG: hypothetical protein M3Y45_06170 [Actinomycetota bacterium]|nr:hypothetical protein [Actinomycetota bacterium]